MRFLFGGRAFAVLVLGAASGALGIVEPGSADSAAPGAVRVVQGTLQTKSPATPEGTRPAPLSNAAKEAGKDVAKATQPAAATAPQNQVPQNPAKLAVQDSRNAPMQFRMQQEGPPGSCAKDCRKWVSAVGAVMRDTATAFKVFARENNVDGATLALDSSGGSVLGALELGRAIRAHDMTTTVGRTIVTRLVTEDPAGPAYAMLSPRADCESMCAFVLLAGTRRDVPREARVLVHEIWLGDRRDDATAANYSAEDIVVVQRDIGSLAKYTVEMGGGIDLLEMALRIPPWEPMRRLTRAELVDMKLDTVAGSDDEVVTSSVRPPLANVSFGRASASSEKGWMVADAAAAPALMRQHPLTVEGNEIGTFALEFACANTPDSFAVTYRERRAGAIANPVSAVKIQLSRHVFVLDVVSSEQRSSRTALRTEARAVIPADAVQALAAEGSRSVTVATRSGTFDTRIRIGNTGLAKNIEQVATACAAQTSAKRAAPPDSVPAAQIPGPGHAEAQTPIKSASKD